MYGFKSIWSASSSTGCVVLWNSAWILDTRIKFLCGCMGVFFFGVASEALGHIRRELRPKTAAQLAKPGGRVTLTLGYVAQLAAGYMLMLAAMTYQVEIFVFGLAGLGVGYHHLNQDASVPERVDPCCADVEDAGESQPLVKGTN